MVYLNVDINDKLDAEFRRMIGERLGTKRGNLQLAVEEALSEWIERRRKKSPTELP
jgi:hypothetical protein